MGALSEHGFLVNKYLGPMRLEEGYGKWGVDQDGSIQVNPESEDPVSAQISYTGVEVQSPVFLLGSDAFREIVQFLEVLKLHFDVFVNPSCGLHVHVGDGNKGFPLDTVKNLCLLATGFEQQFNSLHPLHRIDNLYAKPPGRALPPGSPLEKLAAIDALTSISDIVEHFNVFEGVNDPAMAYNLGNLLYTNKHTIEFRQHAGSLEPMEVIKWVELVTGLVTLSHETPYPAFGDFLRDHINDSRFSVIDLLHAMNLHDVAEYYQLRGIFTHPPQEWDWVDPSPIADRKAIKED